MSQSAVANDTELGTIEDTVIKQISDIQQQEDSLYLGSREKLTVTRDNLKYYQIQYESVPKLDVDTYTEFPDNLFWKPDLEGNTRFPAYVFLK